MPANGYLAAELVSQNECFSHINLNEAITNSAKKKTNSLFLTFQPFFIDGKVQLDTRTEVSQI